MIGKNRIQKPRRVLVVDDQEINRDILGVILEDYYEVEYAADGAEALRFMGPRLPLHGFRLAEILGERLLSGPLSELYNCNSDLWL